MANEQNLIPAKKGEVRNPYGLKGKDGKKGIHLSEHIQNMLNDPNFELKLKSGEVLREMPIKAIIKTAIAKSVSGDTRAMEWLAKHGYGEKLSLEVTDTRKEILARYGLGADDVRQTQEIESGSSKDPE